MDSTTTLIGPEPSYLKLRQRLYNFLRNSENLLFTQNIAGAFQEVRKAFESLKEIKGVVEESKEAEFSYDLSKALQLQAKILRIREEGMEDETELLLEALELSNYNRELRDDIVKFAITNVLIGDEDVMLMPNSSKSRTEKILGLLAMISSRFTQSLLLIELNNRGDVFQTFPSLPRLDSLSSLELSQLLKLASRSKERDRILSWLLEMKWICEPLVTEEILVRCLWLSSQSEIQVKQSFLIFGRYTQLTIADRREKWKYVQVVLTLTDRMILQLSGKIDSNVLEKWLGGAALLASVFDKHKEYQHFAKHLMALFLKQGKIAELDKYISSISRRKVGGILKLICLRDLHGGNIHAAAPKLAEMLRVGSLQSALEVESLLRSALPSLLEEDDLCTELLGGMLDSLTENQFYFSLPLFQLCLQLAVRLDRLDLLARRLYDDPNLEWCCGQDQDCKVSSLCWNLAETVTTPLTKHFLYLLAAELLPWHDTDRDQVILASLTSGGRALSQANWNFKGIIMTKLVESVDYLEGRLKGEFLRYLLLFKFQMVQATQRECKWDPGHVLADLIKAKDNIGLLAFTKVSIEDSRYIDFTLTALCEAMKLEDVPSNRELVAVMALEQIRAFPHSAKVWQVSSQLNSVTWTERSLLVEALKISWNIWVSVVSRGESRELRDIWFEAMMILHNKATEECDHISCRLEKPTPVTMDPRSTGDIRKDGESHSSKMTAETSTQFFRSLLLLKGLASILSQQKSNNKDSKVLNVSFLNKEKKMENIVYEILSFIFNVFFTGIVTELDRTVIICMKEGVSVIVDMMNNHISHPFMEDSHEACEDFLLQSFQNIRNCSSGILLNFLNVTNSFVDSFFIGPKYIGLILEQFLDTVKHLEKEHKRQGGVGVNHQSNFRFFYCVIFTLLSDFEETACMRIGSASKGKNDSSAVPKITPEDIRCLSFKLNYWSNVLESTASQFSLVSSDMASKVKQIQNLVIQLQQKICRGKSN